MAHPGTPQMKILQALRRREPAGEPGAGQFHQVVNSHSPQSHHTVRVLRRQARAIRTIGEEGYLTCVALEYQLCGAC